MPLGDKIKTALADASKSDGLKRTQRWLAARIGMGEVELSNKMANVKEKTFTNEELKKINNVLGTDF